MQLTGKSKIYNGNKFIFGITGPTGSGKTAVSDLFRKKGVFVCDADIAARTVMRKGCPCLLEVAEKFGDTVLFEDGSLNRKFLADIVFSDESKLRLLNSISHKYIKEHIKNEIKVSDSRIAAIDGAVLIGSSVMELCNLLVVVTADDDIRLGRIIERDGIDKKSALARMNSQMPCDEYEKYADYIIKNNDGYVRLEECVGNVYSKIKTVSETGREVP